jgi:methyl-accepting chemotaxis protein
MKAMKAIYLLVERYLFNSISKKILGCLLPLLAMLFYLAWESLALTRSLQAGSAGTTRDMLELLARSERLATLLPILAVVVSIGAFLAFYYSLAVPLKRITKVIQEGDFSKDITLETHDEVRRLADSHNLFAARIRDILGSAKHLGLSIAVGSTRTTKLTTDSAQNAQQQGEFSDRITRTSREVAEAIGEVAKVTGHLNSTTQENLQSARGAHQELLEADRGMAHTNQRLAEFSELVARLEERS